MKGVLAPALLAVLLLRADFALLAEDVYYRVDLAPSGAVFARELPVTRGTMVVFHEYPDGTFVSFPRSKIRQVVRVSGAATETRKQSQSVIAIGNLAMQGASSSGPPGREAAGTAAANPASTAPRWNGYDGWAVLPDEMPPPQAPASAPKTP